MYNPQQFPMGPGQPGAGAAYSAGPNVMPGGAGPGAMMQNPGAHMAGPNGQSTSPSPSLLGLVLGRVILCALALRRTRWYDQCEASPDRPCCVLAVTYWSLLHLED